MMCFSENCSSIESDVIAKPSIQAGALFCAQIRLVLPQENVRPRLYRRRAWDYCKQMNSLQFRLYGSYDVIESKLQGGILESAEKCSQEMSSLGGNRLSRTNRRPGAS